MARQRFRVAFNAQRNKEGELSREYVILDLGDPDQEHPDGPYVHDDEAQQVGKPFPDTPEGLGKASALAFGMNAENDAAVKVGV